MDRVLIVSGFALLFAILALCHSLSFYRNKAVPDDEYTSHVNIFYQGIRAASVSWLNAFISIHGEGVNSILKRIENHVPSPFYALTQMKEDNSDSARAVISLVFTTFEFANNDGSYLYHPLTNAYRFELYNLAKRFLTPQPTDRGQRVIREVYASMLECNQIAHVDPTVTLVVHGNDTRGCVLSHGRLRNYQMSHLRILYLHQHNDSYQGLPPPRNLTHHYSRSKSSSSGAADVKRTVSPNSKQQWPHTVASPLRDPLLRSDPSYINTTKWEDLIRLLWRHYVGAAPNMVLVACIALFVVLVLTLIQCVWIYSIVQYLTYGRQHVRADAQGHHNMVDAQPQRDST